MVRLKHHGFEEGEPIPRDAEGKRAEPALQDSLVIAVPVDSPAPFRGCLEEEVLDLALERLVEGPLKLGPYEGIQVLFDDRGGFFGRHG